MKAYIFFFIALFSVSESYAQKDSLPVVNPNIKINPVKIVNYTLVNQKLVALQATVKKLVITFNEAKALMEDLKKQKDAMSELSDQDMFFLQQFMEKKGQLEQMISNIMKAASEAQNNIVKNLKAP